MRVYVGQTRDPKLISRLRALRIGECTCRGELPPKRSPYFYDNGAFSDWQGGRSFNGIQFERDMRRLSYWNIPRADFVVLPDIVGGGSQSLAFSRSYLDGAFAPFHGYSAPVYLAVQDGMKERDIEPLVPQLDGLFVGGTLEWKLATAPAWVKFAGAARLACHLGRCGTFERVQWAREIGVDSIDSSLPLWSEEKLARFLEALIGLQLSLDLSNST